MPSSHSLMRRLFVGAKKVIGSLFVVLTCVLLLACKDTIVSNNEINSSAESKAGADFDNGFMFLNNQSSNQGQRAVFTFRNKPNEEVMILSLNDKLFFRDDETPLNNDHIEALSFKLQGANADVFTLQKASKQWQLIFNKDLDFFYDEVEKKCGAQCDVNVLASAPNGTQAAAFISVKLLPADTFSLTAIRKPSSSVNPNNQDFEKYTINVTALALENARNRLFFLPTKLINGVNLPNFSNFTDLKYDADNNGTVDTLEREIAARKEFWGNAAPSALMFKQVKYYWVKSTDSPKDTDLFSLDFEQSDPWFDAYEFWRLRNDGVLDIDAEYHQRKEIFKNKHNGRKLPVIYFDAPALSDNQKMNSGNGCKLDGVRVPFYYSSKPFRTGLRVLSTDSGAKWVRINLSVYVVGSNSGKYRFIGEKSGNNYKTCRPELRHSDGTTNSNRVFPSLELLPAS